MASTQNLTELPTIQYTGMDYNTVISQIKEIIENNSNWSKNWTQFYNSEAGTMLIQLMSWICDNLAIRQDLLYNEQFLATASSSKSKLRLLNQIGYVQKAPSAAIVPISIELQNVNTSVIELSCCRDDENSLAAISNCIYNFSGPDINGKNVNYEILSVNSDGTINYTSNIKLSVGNSVYTKDTLGRQLTAVQGTTVYKEFSSDTRNGPVFVLNDSNIDLKTLAVYDITAGNILHKKVDNFIDLNVLNGEAITYIIEKNDSGNFQIRYADAELVKYGNTSLEDRLFPAGHTIGVLYRTCSGSDGNIPVNYIHTDDVIYDKNGDETRISITNILAGTNGEDGESLETAVKNAPLSLTAMNRAVTITDYDRILKNNDLVLNCKSYSPENMPEAFTRYFGRKINPQEIFSFMVLNKNFNSCPNSSLNYFPWIELNKDPILNESYVFGEANLNVGINSSGIYTNTYIRDDYAEYKKTAYSGTEYDNGSDKGQWYYDHYSYDYYKNDLYNSTLKARMLKNFSLFKTSKYLGNTIKEEKSTKNYQMKLKIHEKPSNSMYIDEIENSLSNEKVSMGTNNNVYEVETSAQYTALNSVENYTVNKGKENEKTYGVLDCINYRFIKFVLDDNIVVTVDLHKEKMSDDEISKYDVGIQGGSGYVKAKYKTYYLPLTNNHSLNSDSYYSELKDKFTLIQANKEMISYINSKEYVQYRTGILELIREAVKKYTDYGITTFDLDTYKGDKSNNLLMDILNKGELKEQINSTTGIYSYNNEIYVVNRKNNGNKVNYSRIYETVSNEMIEENITENDSQVTRQEYTYRSALSNGSTAFIDLGMQEKNLDMQDPNLETGGYLYNSYKYTLEGNANYYTAAERKCLYTLKINDNIYAFRLDAYTAAKAYETYKELKNSGTTTSSEIFFDYFNYLGKGNIFSNISIDKVLANNELQQTFASIKQKYSNYFSRDIISSSCIAKDKMIKMLGDNIAYSDTTKIDHTYFAIGSIATTLEYLVSPFNVEPDTVFMFVPTANGKSGSWIDIKSVDDSYIKNNLRLLHGRDKNFNVNNRSIWINIKNFENPAREFKNSKIWENISGFNNQTIDLIVDNIINNTSTNDDVYNFRNILNGKLRVRTIHKANYDTNSSVSLSDTKKTNYFGESSGGKEWDIRFEYINGEDNLRISSVAEKEISDTTIDKITEILVYPGDSVNGKTSDLIQNLIGYRRQYEASPVSYLDKEDEVASLDNGILKIKSLNIGKNSSIYFIQTAQREALEIMHHFGLVDLYPYTWNAISDNEYFERARSIKAYGIRRIELYIADNDNDETQIFKGVPVEDLKKLFKDESKTEDNALTETLSVGDLLITSNDINYVNSQNYYISYVLKNGRVLKIDKYDNFYYSSNSESNEYAKPDIVGIEGQSVYKNEYGEYCIDVSKSKFGIKITKDKVDTNSYYAISQDTYNELNIIENKPVSIETFAFDGLQIGINSEDAVYTQFGGAGRGLDTNKYPWSTVKTAVSYEVPVIIGLDDNTLVMPKNGTVFTYNESLKDYIIVANPGQVKNASGSSLYSALLTALKEHNNEYMSNNYYSIIKKYYNSTNKIIINGITSTDSGCLVFYYPDKATCETCFKVTDQSVLSTNGKEYDLAVKLFYRNMFGTNKTNPDFYKLFPKDEMVGVSYGSEDDTNYLNDEDVVNYLNNDYEEYFYCPTKGHHLKFVYRSFVDIKNEKSKFGDYYVTVRGKSTDYSFTKGYNFYLYKTPYSTFPDCYFYLHFVNDRSYEYKRTSGVYKTEQDSITEYMSKYKITGTEINFLKPYFKTFDIVASVNYNANYDVSTVKSNIESTLKRKYKIENVSDISVGNTIYRSDVFKTMLGITGVESVEIEYFGYDYTNQEKYPDQKYYLSVGDSSENSNGSEFYIVSVLADNTTDHGLILSYKKAEAIVTEV